MKVPETIGILKYRVRLRRKKMKSSLKQAKQNEFM